jgi:alkylhydroperoxidase family enzyme
MAGADLAALRAHGLDDRDLLHAIALVGLANALSRLTLALGPLDL